MFPEKIGNMHSPTTLIRKVTTNIKADRTIQQITTILKAIQLDQVPVFQRTIKRTPITKLPPEPLPIQTLNNS